MKIFKRTLSILLSLLIVIAMVPMSLIESSAAEFNSALAQLGTESAQSEASDVVPEGLEYNTVNDVVTITGYTGEAEELVIPSEIDGYPVEAIGDYAFSYAISLKSVELPEGLKTLGRGAFYGCDALAEFEIPASVTSIGYAAFYWCQSLKSIKVPDGVKQIEDEVFCGCSGLEEIWLPAGITSIGSYAFSYCDALDSVYCSAVESEWANVTIGEGNEIFDTTTIYYADTMPEGLQYSIANGEATITGYTGSVSKLVLPMIIEGCPVTSIGNSAFEQNDILTNVVVRDGVKKIGKGAFAVCPSIKSIFIPDSVVSIEDDAFFNCFFSSFEIPNNVISIGEWAFACCHNLKSIEIPDSVISIGEYVFGMCGSLTSISVDENNPVYDSRGNCNAIVETATNEIIAGCSQTVIPNGVKRIEEGAFYWLNSLNDILIPDSVTSIGDSAFEGSSLTDVYFGGSQEEWNAISIGSNNECLTNATIHFAESVPEGLQYSIADGKVTITGYTGTATELTIPAEIEGCPVTAIGAYAFHKCETLISVKIPDSVMSIGIRAFAFCNELSSVKMSDSVIDIGSYAFESCSALKSIEIPVSVISIGDCAFEDCYSLTSVEIPASVTSIGTQVFSGSSLNSIKVNDENSVYDSRNNCNAIIETATNTLIVGCGKTEIPDTVIVIGDYAFAYCESLTGMEIPDSITSIGENAFYECSSLISIEIPDSVNRISGFAFMNCTNLESVEISGSINWIAESLFSCCTSLESIVIPGGVDSIGVQSFYQCDNLTSVYIPDSVTYVYEEAFSECTALKDVYYSGTEGQWSEVYIDYNNDCLLNANIHFAEISTTSAATKDEEKVVAYVVNSLEWPGVYAYLWSDLADPAAKWPGVPMQKTDMTVNGFDVYALTFDSKYTNVIFNYQSNLRTNDLYVQDGEFYDLNTESWYTSPDSIPDVEKYPTDRFLAGSFNKWSTTANEFELYSEDDRVGYVTLTLEADTIYEFKIVREGTWTSCKETLSITDSVEELTFSSKISDNTVLTTKAAGEYVFAFGLDSSRLSVIYPIEPAETTTGAVETLAPTSSDDPFGTTAPDTEEPTETPATVAPVETITIYFSNNYDWNKVYVHYTGVVDTDTNGIEMSVFGENASKETVYYCEIPKDTDILWFTDGGSNITQIATDITDSTGYYLGTKTNGKWLLVKYTYNPNSVTFYYTNTLNWTDVYLHYWGDEVTTWPGVQMELYGVNEKGQEVYTYTVPGGTVGLVFSNGKGTGKGNQSEDITQGIENNMCFTPSDSLGWDVGSQVIDPAELTPVVSEYFLRGEFNDWLLTHPMTKNEDGSWVVDIELAAGTYEYKITSADWNVSHPSSVTNAVVRAEVAGKYTFTLHPDKSISYIGPDAYTPEQIVNVIAIGEIGKISLSWSESSEVKTSSYRIYRKAEDAEEFTLIKTINNRNTLTYEDTKVNKNKSYSYYVTGVGLYNIESKPSMICNATVLSDVTAPVVMKMIPADKSTICSNTYFSVTATDNIGVTKTAFYYSVNNGETWTLIGESNGSGISFNTNQFTDEEIKIKAVAYDAEGNESDPLINTYTVDNVGPDKVEGLSAVALSSKLTVSWEDVEAMDAKYFVLQQKDGETWRIVASSITTLGYTITKLNPDTEYTFRVACADVRGNLGEYSDEFTTRTLADTSAPVITAQSPAPARYNSTVAFSATAQDDCDIEKIEIQTSSDAKNWSAVSEKVYTARANKQTYSYSIDLSAYEEGSLFVRAVATDFSGNISDTGESAPYTEYIVDRTAPAKPTGLTANGNEGYITVAWNMGSEFDIKGYSLYRSNFLDGNYTLVVSGLASVNYHDRNVQDNTEYFYKVCVKDSCGNVSEYSDVVSATMSPDSQKPAITGISTTDSKKISNSMCTVNVSANDNNKLSYMVVEYSTSKKMEYTELVRYTNINNSYKNASVVIPVEGLGDGDIVYLRAYCVDMAGLRSAYESANYTVDNTAPKVENLSSAVNNNEITLTWSDGGESDLSGFKVYRSVDNGSYKLLGSRGASALGKYSFTDTVNATTSAVYTYRVDAIDKVGNTASDTAQAEYTYTYVYVNTPPVAEINIPSYMTVGVEELFDASASYDNLGIESYLWDFGDGTSSDLRTPAKKYTEVGKYTVTLTVTDNEGLSASVSETVEVKEREVIGTLNVKVIDDTGMALSYVPVYFDLGSDNQKIVYTSASGTATLQMSSGTHTIGMYAAGYLPVKKDVVVLANATRTVTLTTVEENIVTGNFEITRMTFEEIVAAGIDVYDPANQNVYSATVRVTYGSSKQPVKINYVRNDNEIIEYTITDTNGNPITYYTNDNGEKRKITGVTYIPSPSGGGSGGGASTPSDVVAIMDVPAEASYLKEFFDVRLHIVNNASSEFVVENNEVVLNVPDGLTLMTDVGGGYLTSNVARFDAIKGQQTVTLAWVIRGDESGTYDLSADFTGTLAEFNELVTAHFVTDEPLKVYGLEGVKFRMLFADEIHNDTLYFNVELENERDIDIYMPSIGFTEKIENVTGSALNDNADEDFFTNAYILNAYVQLEGGNKLYLPVSFDANGKASVGLDTLAPNQKLVYEYVAYNAINYNGTAYFKSAVIKEFEGIIDNIEVGSFHKELYSFDNYSEKLDTILSGSVTDVEAAYQYILLDDNYYYVSEAEDTGANVCQFAYKAASVALNLDLSVFTQDEKRELIQQTILSVLSESSVIYEVENSISVQYVSAINDMLNQVKTGLISENADVKSVTAAITTISKESASLAKTYRTKGKEAFQQELGKKLSAYSLGVTVDVLDIVTQIDDEKAFSTALGKAKSFFGDLLSALEESEKEAYYYSVIKTQCNADISNKILDAIIEADKSNLVTSVAKDMKKQLNENMDEYFNGINVIINMAEDAARDFVKGKLKVLLKKGLSSTPVILITAAFNIADAIFGFNSYVKQQDAFDVYNVLAESFKSAYFSSIESRNSNDDIYSLLYLRALCEIRLSAESRFKNFMDEYIDGVYFAKVEKATILGWINKVKNTTYTDYDVWWDDVQYNILHSRDILFNVEALSDINIPRAPVVTLDYDKLETVQKFSSEYEYCFADGEWKSCTGDAIKFTVKVVPGTLRVRKAASADSLAGEIKTVKIFARKDLSKLITVKFDGRTYLIDNLTSSRNYEVAFVNSADEVVDWTTAKTISGSESTVKIYGMPEYDYVVIRSCQNSNLNETTSNPLVRTVQKKHTLDLTIDGSGTVSQTSTTGTYFNGESIDLVATASEGCEFIGWYIGGQCVSNDTFYIAEMDNGLSITAKFTGAKLESIEITELPEKLTYLENEELNDHGMKVVAIYDDGTTTEVTDYTAVVTSGVVGESQVDVNFGGKKTFFEITIEHDDTGWITVSEAAPGTDGYRYKACYACKNILDEESEHVAHLDFSGASLSLTDNLAINYKVKKALFEETGYTDPYVVFELNGVKTTVSEYTTDADKYVFKFDNIAPCQVKDTVNATLYATYDGEEYSSVTRPYSVAEYCYSTLNSYSQDKYAELRTLLVDLLNYCAVSQQYVNYKTDDLANAELTETQKQWGTSETPELSTVLNTKYKVVENPKAKWKGAGLALNDAVSMRFKFTADSIENLSVQVKTDFYEWIIPSEEFVEGDGFYYIYFNELGVGYMREPVYLTILEGDEAVSNTVVYSIESYAYEKQASTIKYLADLVKSMMKYGDSAYAYAN